MKIQKYIENPHFREFVSREFRNVAREATIEELAEFAFGDIKKAIETFEQENQQ